MDTLTQSLSKPRDTKERVAFDLMLKIAQCHQPCSIEQYSGADKTKCNYSCHDIRSKDDWLNLYAECLAVVRHKKSSQSLRQAHSPPPLASRHAHVL